VSYFQAGKICDYINEKYGYAKLLAMIHAFAANKTTPEVVQEQIGVKPEEFDQQFMAWLDSKTHKTVAGFADWKTRIRGVAQSIKAQKWDDAITEGKEIEDIYPDYVEHNSVYELMAEAYRAKSDPASAIRELEKYANTGGRNPAVLKQLASLEEAAGDKRAAAATLNRLNYIYPMDQELHQRLGSLLLDMGNSSGAIREFQAVIDTKPLDVAGAHFALARAYRAARKNEQAKDEVLQALEAAPGFRPAQRLLLELDGKD
jgi:cellulose synthase operon protein C